MTNKTAYKYSLVLCSNQNGVQAVVCISLYNGSDFFIFVVSFQNAAEKVKQGNDLREIKLSNFRFFFFDK